MLSIRSKTKLIFTNNNLYFVSKRSAILYFSRPRRHGQSCWEPLAASSAASARTRCCTAKSSEALAPAGRDVELTRAAPSPASHARSHALLHSGAHSRVELPSGAH